MTDLKFSSKNELKLLLKTEKYKKIFIICGEKSFIHSGAKKLLNDLLINSQTYYFFKKHPYPDIIELKQIINALRNYAPNLIIAVGGGSVLDYAKVANCLAENENLEEKIKSSTYNLNGNFSKLLAIPTTAGSGAEVTSNAVIYIDKIKYSVEGDKLKPDYFFLLPELVIGASNKIKSSAGFDAIAQALESLISKKSNKESLDFAVKSLKISINSYLPFLEKPNMNNATEMSIASNLAGKAISISKTTVPHATSYPFTSLFNISHGHAVSLFFEHFFKFNFDNLDKANTTFDLNERFKLIFKLFDVKNINDFNTKITLIKKRANLIDNLNELNIDINKNSERIIQGINLLRLGNNPVKVNKFDIIKVISK